ncbi:MAG: hypothetical protein ACSHYB_17270 [Roseibacillus sp.]
MQRAIFMEAVKFRAGNVIIDYGLIDQAQKKAQDWINIRRDIEVLTIETFHCSTSAKTVVWYR